MFYITQTHTVEDIIKKSRFIGVLIPCKSESDVLCELRKLQSQHPHANHIAFAYRFKTKKGINYRFYDAGEPTGTAGKPIFQHLEGKNLIDVLAVVIRYFGGVKLGAGGLTRAYGNAARQVIENASLQPYIEREMLFLTLDYDQFQPFEYALKKVEGQIVEQHFAEQIQLTIQLPAEKAAELKHQFPTII